MDRPLAQILHHRPLVAAELDTRRLALALVGVLRIVVLAEQALDPAAVQVDRATARLLGQGLVHDRGQTLVALAPLAGARLTYLRVELDVDPGPTVDDSESWVDPLIGLRGDLELTERLALFAEADVGGFGIGSDLAWNAQLFLTYRTAVFGVATDLALGYRALRQDYDHNDFAYDVTTSGPIIGAAFHF
jgi:hypothetical protein